MKKEVFLAIVLAELITIKSKLSNEVILSRLNFEDFDHTQRNKCLLAQLVQGRSVNSDSHNLIPPTFKTVILNERYPRFVSFEDQSFEEGDELTAVEKYFYMTTREKHEEVFKFLKGEITEIEL
jgi:hypothetical protein